MSKHIPNLELTSLITLIIGFALQTAGLTIPVLLTIGLVGLGLTFFLNAFIPKKIESKEGEQLGFNELLGLSILPKVLWHGMGLATIGILLHVHKLQLGFDGYVKILYIAGLTILIASVAILVLKANGTKYMNATIPIFYRAVPVFLIVAYILFG